ncbi:SDR family NAD(P)-dependent oxidoreductase [Neisseria zoodegmatis]|uniref:Oxidoreductase n=1 Tax=Neisseria zoodegmatis TaxID=326523 RepID=A0AB38DSL1_9NEIS|nr:SDR family NAD(P)-dependent oxidoreductase [Neisseria zoodegmatis]OSI11295.1 short-chain dehydrogenase [Neisseria zoodegmatis]SNU80400.1 oxidoreductase [Neisseria zoodegmatis]
MNSKIIITGHSSGLGLALAGHYLQQGCSVLGLARRQAALRPSEKLIQHSVDLSCTQAVSALLSDGLIDGFIADADEIVFINNAAVVTPNAVAGRQDAGEIAAAVSLNVAAPLLLTNHVIACKPAGSILKIVHISSGAGRNAYPGWSVYGATKAALDHHARCIAAEQHAGVAIAAIAPGVVDTDMQAEIRAADAGVFPIRQRFHDLKEQGGLSSPADTATRIAAMIEDSNFGSETLDDVRRSPSQQ